MNNYPLWWDSTVTIYNKYTNPDNNSVYWYRTVLNNCFWHTVSNRTKSDTTNSGSYSVICRIPIQETFKSVGAWLDLPSDDRGDYFTLAPNDIIVLGESDIEIDEYTSGLRSSDFLTNHHRISECMEISEVSINTLTGFSIPHYSVRGL